MATNEEETRLLIDLDTIEEKEQEQEESEKTSVDIKTLEETIQKKLKIINETDQDKFEKITITKEIFEQIKKSLQETIASMEKNPSMFSRAAEYWGELPLWQKIIGGVALTVPTLIMGIVAHIGFLLAICGVTAVTYAAGGIMLDDHHKCSTSAVESLQKGVLSLANLLELTITALDIIRQQLAVEIQKFAKENERLTGNIEELSKKIDLIDKQVMATAKINEVLGGTKDGLVEAAETLKGEVGQQTDLMKKNQEKLDRITEGYISSQKELAEKVLEVQKVRDALGKDLENAKLMIDTLHGTISQLSTAAIGNEEQRLAFQERLNTFISDKEASFHSLAERIFDAERKLALVQKELERSNLRYQELLDKQEKHIDILQTLSAQPSADQAPQKIPMGELLAKKGIYATKQEGTGNGLGSDLTSTPVYN
ncbi:inclusion membrane protein A [Legionella steigerwaltii]|uniref:Inclusion membrane protein A n=1 Tax=Legionella steigerwaltii TaxID=460 RepID=A0A378LCJ7_9GAMM|nr:LegC2/C7 family Dot/Icm T4SS effector [Legionella steigerwaltii]KTD79529.1 inclusion membrane protein A [Legionella steigerwaltii]STY24586.1 inclusion membrane protein A [Legionella steigerwaltii]